MVYISHIQRILDVIEGCKLCVKRDGLLPFPFGNNKYRIANELVLE